VLLLLLLRLLFAVYTHDMVHFVGSFHAVCVQPGTVRFLLIHNCRRGDYESNVCVWDFELGLISLAELVRRMRAYIKINLAAPASSI
jgi:hypothetical protein